MRPLRSAGVAGLVALFLTALAVGDAGPRPVTFSREQVGRLPPDWKAARTGEGEGSVWKVVADDTAPGKTGHALAQIAEGPNRLFNLCLLDQSSFRDGELSVRARAVAGKLDQGGGLLWRCRDADNYYVCRYNPLEKNLRLYYVKEGKRTQLATREDLALPEGRWFTVTVRHKGDRIACGLEGKTYIEVTDGTIPDAGRVGLWTKADARTHFDLLRVAPVGR